MTDLIIPKPCHETWDAMTPRDDGRHCASCSKTVVDLTGFDAETGARVLARIHAEVSDHAHICVHAPADAAGRIVFPARVVAMPHRRPGLTRSRRLLTNGLAAVLAMVVAGDLASAADSADGTSATAPVSACPPEVTRTPLPAGQDETPVPTPSATTGAVMPRPHIMVTGQVALPPRAGGKAQDAQDATPAPGPVTGEAQVQRSSTKAADF